MSWSSTPGPKSISSFFNPFVFFAVKALNTGNGLCVLCVKF